jgi:hypothetical protein
MTGSHILNSLDKNEASFAIYSLTQSGISSLY